MPATRRALQRWRSGVGIWAVTRSTSAGRVRDETSAALAAVDMLVQAELQNRGKGPRAAQLGARRRDQGRLKRVASRSPTPPTGHGGRCWVVTQVDAR